MKGIYVISFVSVALVLFWAVTAWYRHSQFAWHPATVTSLDFPAKDMLISAALDLLAAAFLGASYALDFRLPSLAGLLVAAVADFLAGYDVGCRVGYRLGGVEMRILPLMGSVSVFVLSVVLVSMNLAFLTKG